MCRGTTFVLTLLFAINVSGQFEQLDKIIYDKSALLPLNRVILSYHDSILVYEEYKPKSKTIKFFYSDVVDSINVSQHCFFTDGNVGTLADSADKKLVLTSILFDETGLKFLDKVTYNNANNIKLYPNYITFEMGNYTYLYKDGRLLYRLAGSINEIYLDSQNDYYCPKIVKNKILIKCKDRQYSIGINDQKINYFIDYNTVAYDTTWGSGIVQIDYDNNNYIAPNPGYRMQYGNERTGLYIFTYQKSGLFLYRGSKHTFTYCADFLGDDEGIYLCNGELEGKSEVVNFRIKKSKIKVRTIHKIDYPIAGAIEYKNGILYSPIIGFPNDKLELINKINPYYKSNECFACLGLKSVNNKSYIRFHNRQTCYFKDSNNTEYPRPLELAQFTVNPVVNGYMNSLGLVILQEFSGSLVAAVERGRLYTNPGFGDPWEYDIDGRSIINPCHGRVIGIGDSSTLVYFETPNRILVYNVDLYRSFDNNWDFTDSIFIGPNKLIPLNEFEYIGSVDSLNLFYFNPKNGLKCEYGAFSDKNLLARIKFFKKANKKLLALTYDNELLLFNDELLIIDSIQLSNKKMRSVTIVGSGKKQEVIFSSISVNEAIEQKLLSKPGKITDYQITLAHYLNGNVKMWNNQRKNCVRGFAEP